MDITSKIRKLNRIYLPVLIFNILLLATCLNPVQGADNIEVKQDFIISDGSFGGDAELYNEYNQGQIPSLSPHIEYKTTMKGNFVEEGQYSLKFLLSAGEKKDEYLDLQYQNFGFKIGSQVYDIPIYGFNYRKRLEGMKGYYQSDKLQLEIFDSFQQSRYTEVKLQGNDSIGPYFVGHKDILQNSEKVYIDGVKQTRGEDQGDYYMDYEGGFIYFNKIVLEQEEIKISFEYELEEKEYRGKLYGGDLSCQLNESMTVEGYFLNDNLPLKEDSIYKEAGYKNQTVGVSLITNRKNYYLKNALLFTNLNKKKLDSLPVVESLVVNSGEPKQEIVLKHSPVLYESEKILTEKGEELERNLDYRVLYNKGKIIFNKEFARDQVLEVSYEYLDSSGKLITEQKEGFKNTNLFSYQNKTVAGKTKLDYYVGEFTDFNVLQEVPLKLNLESENKYNFNRQWTGLLDYKLIDSGKSGEENNYSTSVGLDYNNNNNFTGSLKYNRKYVSDAAGEPEFTEQFESNFSYDFPFLTVKSSLIHDFFTGIIKPDKYNIKLAGEKGKYKYSGGYRHNFSGFQEQIFFAFQHSGQFKNINFTNQMKNNFYFKDGFSGPEKRISLWANEARYTQGKYYLNSNL
ncbi:MAG: hypothetical protein ACOC1S_00625, partial [bacterium]